MEHYHMLRVIGQGCFGKVFKGRRRYTGQIVALKFISKRGKADKDIQSLRLEIGILQRLDHPNIIRMLDSFETNSDFVVVTEFAYGELFEIFQDDKHLPVDEVQNIARQLVQALNYIHLQKIIHRDMKPQNVLIGANDVVKLCDFGFARAMSNQTTVLTSIKGTPLYMAPELVQEKPYDGSVDLWSLGVICYELVVGQPPFYTNSLISLIQLIVNNPVQYPDSVSGDFKSFLQGLLQKNPKHRLGWPNLLHHPFISKRNTSSPIQRQSREDPQLVKPTPTSQISNASNTTSCNPSRWQHVFVELLASPPSASGGERLNDAIDVNFATFCLSALKVYADVLENGALINASSKLEYEGLLLSLTGEPQDKQLPLSILVRSLAQILGFVSPPPSFVQCLCNSNSMAICLLRITHVLSGKHAEAWGPPWDLMSDILRLMGLGFRAPIALGMGLSDELLRPDGPLMQYVALVPALIIGGVTGRFYVQSNSWAVSKATVHHLGTAVNSIKCLGVVFNHLLQAAVTSPPSAFVLDVFQCLLDNRTGVQQNPNDADLDSSGHLMLAIEAVCQCVIFRAAPGSSSERLVRAALQTVAALLHPGPGGLTRAGVPWGGTPCTLPSNAVEAARLQAALQGAREVVRRSFRDVLSESPSRVPGSCEMDHAVFGFLWGLRTTANGERLDASTLKILIGLINISTESAQTLAEHRSLADSLMPDSSIGPCAVLAITEATCAGAADQNPGTVWPGVGLLLILLSGCLQPCGDLPLTSLRIGSSTSKLVRPPYWCTPALVYALALRLQSSLARTYEAVLPMLTASYACVFLAALCTALIQQGRHSEGQIFADLRRALSPIEPTLDALLRSISNGRIGRLCLDDMRKAEGVFYGCVMRGPLDGLLSLCLVHQSIENHHGKQSNLAKNAVGYLLGEDPHAVLSVIGPRGLLLLLELLCCFRDSIEASVDSLRFCLSLLWALQSMSVLPIGDPARLPDLMAAFYATMDLILRIFGNVSQVNVMAGSTELHADFQDAKTIPATMHLFGLIPDIDPSSWKTTQETSWHALCSGMQLLSALVLHHQALAHEFVEHQGVQMLVNRRLLTLELACTDAGGSQIVVDALLILSQLSRLSKEYYPMLQNISICDDLRSLLSCGNASVRAKSCNTIGNMARHSDFFYTTIQDCGILPQLIHLCSDSDSACRKFASFAVGNAAFHSEVLYPILASAVTPLLGLLKDDDEKTRANAAGALGNLVRNSTDLCGAMIQEGALQGLFNLVESRLPRHTSGPSTLDSSVKISLFSLGNLAMHSDCRAFMKSSMRIRDLCNQLMSCTPCDDVIRRYAQRLLQKLETA